MGRHHDSKVESRAPEGQMHPFCVGLLGGAAAGLTVNSCLFPLNTIKTRLQARVVGTPIRETLFKNLYRGFIIDTAGSIPGTGLFMASYEVIKATGRVPALVGAASAAGVASLITAPCDAIKQRLQVNASATLANELKAVATSRNPLKTMFVGYPQFLLRDLPFDAIQMTSFEVLKRWHCDAFDPGRPRTAKELALLGGAAGAFTGFVTTPLDVARTAEVCAGLNGVKCTGVMCLVELVRQGGPGVLRVGGDEEGARVGGSVRGEGGRGREEGGRGEERDEDAGGGEEGEGRDSILLDDGEGKTRTDSRVNGSGRRRRDAALAPANNFRVVSEPLLLKLLRAKAPSHGVVLLPDPDVQDEVHAFVPHLLEQHARANPNLSDGAPSPPDDDLLHTNVVHDQVLLDLHAAVAPVLPLVVYGDDVIRQLLVQTLVDALADDLDRLVDRRLVRDLRRVERPRLRRRDLDQPPQQSVRALPSLRADREDAREVVQLRELTRERLDAVAFPRLEQVELVQREKRRHPKRAVALELLRLRLHRVQALPRASDQPHYPRVRPRQLSVRVDDEHERVAVRGGAPRGAHLFLVHAVAVVLSADDAGEVDEYHLRLSLRDRRQGLNTRRVRLRGHRAHLRPRERVRELRLPRVGHADDADGDGLLRLDRDRVVVRARGFRGRLRRAPGFDPPRFLLRVLNRAVGAVQLVVVLRPEIVRVRGGVFALLVAHPRFVRHLVLRALLVQAHLVLDARLAQALCARAPGFHLLPRRLRARARGAVDASRGRAPTREIAPRRRVSEEDKARRRRFRRRG
eukprot:30302-Pelagococcus_subviridis.AAC.4